MGSTCHSHPKSTPQAQAWTHALPTLPLRLRQLTSVRGTRSNCTLSDISTPPRLQPTRAPSSATRANYHACTPRSTPRPSQLLVPTTPIIKSLGSTSTAPLPSNRQTTRAAIHWKALDSPTSLKWLTLWPIAQQRSACCLCTCLNEL